MSFEKFIPPQTSGVRPRATIRPSGLISFDAATVDTFGLDTAAYAVLYFDKTRKMGVEISIGAIHRPYHNETGRDENECPRSDLSSPVGCNCNCQTDKRTKQVHDC